MIAKKPLLILNSNGFIITWELSFLTSNIFGTSQFKRQSLSNTIMSYSITTLRPREYMVKYSFDL